MNLPAAARYLDGSEVEELLQVAVAHAGATLRSAERRSIHTRAGRSVSHVFEARLAAGEVERDVLLVAHADRKPSPDGAFELERDGARVAIWRFPFDPYLLGLPSAIDRGRVRELLDDLGAPGGQVSLRTRAYRPSRRAVVEVTITSQQQVGRILYLKVLAGDRASELASIHRALQDHVPVPRVIGVAAAQGIVALEALEGATLRSALVQGDALPDPASIVGLSHRFAASGLEGRRDPRRFADPRRHVDGLIRLAPERASAIEEVVTAAAQVSGPLVAVHGDLHDGQLLLQDREVTGLLDVDGSGVGYLAHDAGNLIAHVEAIGHLWPEAAERSRAYAASIREAYAEEVEAAQLSRAIAGAWLGLATGPYRAQEEGWLHATRRRIDRALEVMQEA